MPWRDVQDLWDRDLLPVEVWDLAEEASVSEEDSVEGSVGEHPMLNR